MKGLLLVLITAFLLFGCTSDQIAQPTPTSQPTAQPTAHPSATAQPTTETTGCTSPYDGTYAGAMSDSGEIQNEVTSGGQTTKTRTPFLQTYDFEMTVKCRYTFTPTADEPLKYILAVTHAKATHPIFNCLGGCTPVQSTDTVRQSEADLNENGDGDMYLVFPNGATIGAFGLGSDLVKFRSDRAILTITGKDPYDSIGQIQNADGYFTTVEQSTCPPRQLNSYCAVYALNPNTIILYKTS